MLLPLCRRHRFFSPAGQDWFAFFLAPIVVVLSVIYAVMQHVSFESLMATIAGATFVGVCLAFDVFCVRTAWHVRGEYADATCIVLAGAAPKFGQACEAEDNREADRIGKTLGDFWKRRPACPEGQD